MSERGAGGTWPFDALLFAAVPSCALRRRSPPPRLGRPAACASGSRTTRGSSAARARSTTARPARAARRRHRPLQPPLGRSRPDAWRAGTGQTATLVLNGLHARGIAAVVDARRLAALGERRQDAELRAGRGLVRGLRRRGRDALPLGRASGSIWNEPNQTRWLRPTTPSRLRPPLLNPAYDAIHAANPRAKVGGGVTAPRGLGRRRLAGRTGSAACARPAPASTRTRTIRIRQQPRDAVRRRLRLLRRHHDGQPRAAALAGQARVRAEADLAHRVRLPDRPRTASASSGRRS